MKEQSPDVQAVLALIRDVVRRRPPRRWMWGDALYGFALSEWDDAMGTQEFTPLLVAYCEHFLQHPPTVDYADRAAPALITHAVQRKTGDRRFEALTQDVLDYIQHAPRVLGDAVNHLGKSPEGRFYPQSIWVDSLMMFSLFPAIYARDAGDTELLAFAARQPAIYADFMQSPETGLWYHSYWVKARRHHPRGPVFWGRGNGWVMAALPRILDILGPGHPEHARILAILQSTAEALLERQNSDHSFSTLLTQASYRELSATALIAAGLMHGARKGYLPREHAQRGRLAFQTASAAIRRERQGLCLPEVSAPTIPLHLFPSLGYRLTPRGKNLSYGLAAALFAAIEAARMDG